MVIGDWGGIGRINMTDGEINVGWALCMPGVGSGGGENCEASGTLNLYGGTIRCGGLYLNEWAKIPPTWDWVSEWMSISTREPIVGRPSYVDISTIDLAGGELIIDGDYSEIITNYVNQGYVTIYGLQENEILPDGSRTCIRVHYDSETDTTMVMGDIADPNCAYKPDPAHYSKDLPVNIMLSWSPGDGVLEHDVYLGTNFNDVTNADTSDLSGVYKGRQSNDPNLGGGSSYRPPELLEMETTYYWRIDEFDGVNTWRGGVWCFSVGNYYSVDNFNSYANDYDLKAVWSDFEVNGSGAEIAIQNSEDFAPAGNELDYHYNNKIQVSSIYIGSVADVNTPSLEISPDWTTDGLTTSLGLYFYGDPSNSVSENDLMYVAIKDTGDTIGTVLYDGDPNDILEEQWHEWNVDLQQFIDLGVDVMNINKLYIGFGGPRTGQTMRGGTGTVYFNDIRLYSTRCVPSKVIADLTGDCIVNIEDLDWHDPAIPVNPQYAYSQNAFLGADYGVFKESEVVIPSQTLVWVEETIWEIPVWADWVLNDTCFFSRHYQDSTFGDFIATYHNTPVTRRDEGLGNAVFVDGHVELCDPYYTVDLPGGGVARNGFILSWPLKGKYSRDKPY